MLAFHLLSTSCVLASCPCLPFLAQKGTECPLVGESVLWAWPWKAPPLPCSERRCLISWSVQSFECPRTSHRFAPVQVWNWVVKFSSLSTKQGVVFISSNTALRISCDHSLLRPYTAVTQKMWHAKEQMVKNKDTLTSRPLASVASSLPMSLYFNFPTYKSGK